MNKINNFPEPEGHNNLLNDTNVQNFINKVIIDIKNLEEAHIKLLDILNLAVSKPEEAKKSFKFEFRYDKETYLKYVEYAKTCKEKLEKSDRKKYDFLINISNKAIERLDKIMGTQSQINLLLSNFDFKNEINSIINENKKFIESSEEKFKKNRKSIKNAGDRIKTMAESHRTEILGIVTLVFTAFTFIQINFITFSKAVQFENVWNMLFILCSINISLILSTYVIYSIIRKVTLGYTEDKLCWKLKWRLIIPVIILIIGSGISLMKLPKGDLVLKKDFLNVSNKYVDLHNKFNKLNNDYKNLELQNKNINNQLMKLQIQINEQSKNNK